jgi:hypothetical protein
MRDRFPRPTSHLLPSAGAAGGWKITTPDGQNCRRAGRRPQPPPHRRRTPRPPRAHADRDRERTSTPSRRRSGHRADQAVITTAAPSPGFRAAARHATILPPATTSVIGHTPRFRRATPTRFPRQSARPSPSRYRRRRRDAWRVPGSRCSPIRQRSRQGGASRPSPAVSRVLSPASSTPLRCPRAEPAHPRRPNSPIGTPPNGSYGASLGRVSARRG